MISFKITCPTHGDVTVEADDMLIADTSFLVHCPKVDHLFLQALTPKITNVLVGSGSDVCP